MIKIGAVGGRGGYKWDEKRRDQIAGLLVFYDQATI